MTFGRLGNYSSPSGRPRFPSGDHRRALIIDLDIRHLITFRSIGGAGLIPVAAVRDIRRAVPVAGSSHGAPADVLGMSVEVSVNG